MKTLVWLTAKAVRWLLIIQYTSPATGELHRELAVKMVGELNDQLADFERDHMTSSKDRAKYFGKARKGDVHAL
jgi:hypothetical protein